MIGCPKPRCPWVKLSSEGCFLLPPDGASFAIFTREWDCNVLTRQSANEINCTKVGFFSSSFIVCLYVSYLYTITSPLHGLLLSSFHSFSPSASQLGPLFLCPLRWVCICVYNAYPVQLITAAVNS